MTVAENADHDSTMERAASAPRPLLLRLPAYAYVGGALNLAAWISSWGRIGPWPYTFFALWLGFILVLDGVNLAHSGTSPLARSRAGFVALFLCSSPFWWVFEGLNVPVQNWHYVLDRPYSTLAFFLIASLNFSTVLPAVMEMAELLASFTPLRPRLRPPDVGPRVSVPVAALLLALGVVSAVLPFFFPRYAFGLIWVCLIFLLDPINNLARRKSALGHLLAGDWRFLVTLPLAGVCTGFFWEMWNAFALPKWYYTVPFVDAAPHLFEMPLPGYAGYLPFALELFAMYQFVLLLFGRRKDALAI
jgi:hypothetical protein